MLALRSVPAGGSTYYARMSGDNILVFGPDPPFTSPPGYQLTLYYVDSGRIETFYWGEPIDMKAVHGERAFLIRENRLKVVDLFQRTTTYSAVLGFSPRDVDFSVDLNALVALQPNTLHILRLSAR